MSYGRKVVIALDQLINALCGGWPDETLSSRAARLRYTNPIFRQLARFLDWIDTDHSFDALEYEPGTTKPEPHHQGDYFVRRAEEEAALKLALACDDPDALDVVVMQLAETAAKRQRLREEMRDRR